MDGFLIHFFHIFELFLLRFEEHFPHLLHAPDEDRRVGAFVAVAHFLEKLRLLAAKAGSLGHDVLLARREPFDHLHEDSSVIDRPACFIGERDVFIRQRPDDRHAPFIFRIVFGIEDGVLERRSALLELFIGHVALRIRHRLRNLVDLLVHRVVDEPLGV